MISPRKTGASLRKMWFSLRFFLDQQDNPRKRGDFTKNHGEFMGLFVAGLSKDGIEVYRSHKEMGHVHNRESYATKVPIARKLYIPRNIAPDEKKCGWKNVKMGCHQESFGVAIHGCNLHNSH